MFFRRRSHPGFRVEDRPEGRTVVVTGDWTEHAANVLRSGQADGLVLNYAHGYRERSLDFLETWPLRRLDVLARTIDNIEPIYRLAATLEDLSLTVSHRAVLDCERLPTLRKLWVENWVQIREFIARARGLRTLGVHGYEEGDLLAFADNHTLESLTLKQAPRLERLLGIEPMTDLRFAWIAAARNLDDLSSLPSVAGSLRELRIDSCGAVTNITDVAPLQNLSELWIANCGNIDSLDPVTGLTNLTALYLYESTRIADGNLRPLLGLHDLRDLRIMNRRHYAPSVADVKAALGLSD